MISIKTATTLLLGLVLGAAMIFSGPLLAKEKENAGLKKRVKTLETEVVTLQKDVVTLQTDLATLQASIETINTNISALQEKDVALQNFDNDVYDPIHRFWCSDITAASGSLAEECDPFGQPRE